MGPIFYFDEERYGKVRGSSFGEPDGTEHSVELMDGEGNMILRVTPAGGQALDLLFSEQQAVCFRDAADTICLRLGYN